jgi:hypothetical protein
MRTLKTEDGYTFKLINGVWTDGDISFEDPNTLGVSYEIEAISCIWINTSILNPDGSYTDLGTSPFTEWRGDVCAADGPYGLHDHFYPVPDDAADDHPFVIVDSHMCAYAKAAWIAFDTTGEYANEQSIVANGEVFSCTVESVDVATKYFG